ncbi:substrate-binding domain-containing protein [Mesorhizobium sp. BAC0120]|uniref:substrate-binding domain-containing protein n=1 Tax=Mesorhizobium sp. BAC0120 TaxID=3090670 RepID=UPI00298BF892|nr:substrate-binding domain-containing protein [Mesorhizobium sp. BAC0120]MDW6020995.1 substrate-binding domain-containing protein [Mesorhizobium sp. BAC0120]
MSSGYLEKMAASIRAMSAGFARSLMAGALVTAFVSVATAAQARELRVCADPNNLPFSNERGEGFENRIVDIVAKELGADVSYVWWAQRRGFVRNTLKAGLCDLIPGAPAALEMLRTTVPYYRSSYVFVTREGEPGISSFDDPRLRDLKIGVQLIGDDGANSPPVAALARRGIGAHLKGFPVYGDYSTPDPQSEIIEAVASRDIDVAIVWGPLAGFFASRQPVKLRVAPVSPLIDKPVVPMLYDISMGVRRDEKALSGELDAALKKHRQEIDAVLAEFHVPRLDTGNAASP